MSGEVCRDGRSDAPTGGTQERLTQAALELYTEYGYDNATVTEIAERAGITRRSYFRYFPDKREALFAGTERLPAIVRAAVLDAHPVASPLAAAIEALSEVGAALAKHVDRTAERRAVIASSPELQDRERTKLAAVTSAIQDALLQRGVYDDSARLVAQIATIASQNALDRWAEGCGEKEFAACLHAIAVSLRGAPKASTPAALNENSTTCRRQQRPWSIHLAPAGG